MQITSEKLMAGLLILICAVTGCSESAVSLYEGKEDLYGEYLGQPVPDSIPERFCPGFFSVEMHSPPVFSPDGREVYWTLMGDEYNKILEMRRIGDRWSAPAESSFNLRNQNDAPFRLPESVNSPGSLEGSPFIDPEEEFLIFDRMTDGVYADLYISFKDSANQWKEAVSLGDVINTTGHDMYAYVTCDRLFLFFLRSTSSGLFPFWVDAGFIDALR